MHHVHQIFGALGAQKCATLPLARFGAHGARKCATLPLARFPTQKLTNFLSFTLGIFLSGPYLELLEDFCDEI